MQVTLTWNSDADAINGYNVYRGTTSGGENVLLNLSPIFLTTFTDTSPLSGPNYYVVYALGVNNVQSLASNEVEYTYTPTPPPPPGPTVGGGFLTGVLGSLQVTDSSLTFAKTILATFPNSAAISLADGLAINGSLALVLPAASVQLAYVRNAGASAVTVMWEPVNSSPSPATVITLQSGAFILLVETNTVSGITSVVVQSNSATSVDYLLAG